MPYHLILAPEEIKLVHRIYNQVIREPWFDRTDENCRKCARIISQIYQLGVEDESALRDLSLAAGRKMFSSKDDARVSLH